MEITRLEVYPREKEGSKLKAFVDFTLDDCLAIRGAKIIEGNSRLFVAMPGKLNKEGKEENVVFPTNKEMREKLETAIMDEYNRKIKEEKQKINNLNGSLSNSVGRQ